MKLNRRNGREWAVQMLSAADLNPPEDVAAMIATFWADFAEAKPSIGLRTFTEELVTGVLASQAELDAIIQPLLDNWDMYRLGTVERAVLRLGIYELRKGQAPKPVVINEAVDLVNWFSTPKSRTLVNAVLDKYAKR